MDFGENFGWHCAKRHVLTSLALRGLASSIDIDIVRPRIVMVNSDESCVWLRPRAGGKKLSFLAVYPRSWQK